MSWLDRSPVVSSHARRSVDARCGHIGSSCVHTDVGIRELKQHLSRNLDRAAQGETITITVTERGRPKAILGPTPAMGRRLDEGIAAGWIHRPTYLEPSPARVPVIHHCRCEVATLLDADRGE